MRVGQRTTFCLILGSFFLSGVAGLIYQVAWTRYLALFLGHTSYAVMAVLVAFMGGLALGNAWLGPKVDAMARPLRFYAGLELAIGIYALGFPLFYLVLEDAFPRMLTVLKPGPALLLLVKLGFACVAILPPTVAMGATLPALTRYVTRTLAELRGRVAALYAINSSGAVLGVVVADWWWIPGYGLEATVHLGAALSLAVGAMAWFLSGQSVVNGTASGQASAPAYVVPETFTPMELRLAVVGIGVSGFVAMLYEVAWTRLLGLALGSTTHAYSLMLVTFIAGIAAGGWLVARWRTGGDTLGAFAKAELALAATLFVSMIFYERLPYWFIRIASHLRREPGTYAFYELAQGLIAFGVMFVPALCLGTTLPLVSRVATSEIARTGRSVGRVFAVNTLGTVLGAGLTGLVLLPMLGLATTLGLGVGLSGAIGLAVLGWRRRGAWTPPAIAAPVVALVAALVLGFFLGPRWDRSFGSGLWRVPIAPTSWAEFQRQCNDMEYLFHRHGAGSTVSVVRQAIPGRGPVTSLRVNGKADASSGGDMSTQLLLAHIPMLLHSNATRVLVVGCGSGVTVGAALQHPGVAAIDVVEIVPEVVEAAKLHFAKENRDALRDPRVRVHIEDAKTHLRTSDQPHDLIVAEPSNPWMAGVAAVFSREFYEDCSGRLAPGGVMAQWVQTYETDDGIFDMVLATFASVFPHVSLWETGNGDVLLLGTQGPWNPDLDAAARRFAHPSVRDDLARIHFSQFQMVLALQHLAHGDAGFLPADGTQLHSDHFPRLEYRAQRAFFARGSGTKFRRSSELKQVRPRTWLGAWLARHPFEPGDARDWVAGMVQPGMLDSAIHRGYLLRTLSMQPTNTYVLKAPAELAGRDPGADAEMERLARRPEMQSEEALRDIGLLRQYAGLLLLVHRAQRSALFQDPEKDLELFTRVAVKLDEAQSRIHQLHLAEILWDAGRDADFVQAAADGLAAPSGGGTADLSRDAEAPLIVLERMVDRHLRRGEIPAAVGVVAAAKQAGLLTPETETKAPRLSMLARRALAEGATGMAVPGLR